MKLTSRELIAILRTRYEVRDGQLIPLRGKRRFIKGNAITVHKKRYRVSTVIKALSRTEEPSFVFTVYYERFHQGDHDEFGFDEYGYSEWEEIKTKSFANEREALLFAALHPGAEIETERIK